MKYLAALFLLAFPIQLVPQVNKALDDTFNRDMAMLDKLGKKIDLIQDQNRRLQCALLYKDASVQLYAMAANPQTPIFYTTRMVTLAIRLNTQSENAVNPKITFEKACSAEKLHQVSIDISAITK